MIAVVALNTILPLDHIDHYFIIYLMILIKTLFIVIFPLLILRLYYKVLMANTKLKQPKEDPFPVANRVESAPIPVTKVSYTSSASKTASNIKTNPFLNRLVKEFSNVRSEIHPDIDPKLSNIVHNEDTFTNYGKLAFAKQMNLEKLTKEFGEDNIKICLDEGADFIVLDAETNTKNYYTIKYINSKHDLKKSLKNVGKDYQRAAELSNFEKEDHTYNLIVVYEGNENLHEEIKKDATLNLPCIDLKFENFKDLKKHQVNIIDEQDKPENYCATS
jgi:hypothetical protein